MTEPEPEEPEPEMKGTPITRGGGRFIRVGWCAVGYSVDQATQSRYRALRVGLFVVAVALGVLVVQGTSYVFFTYASPLAAKFVPAFKNYPQLFQLLIYLSTLLLGGLIFWHLRAKAGERLVRGQAPVHQGYGLLEQRRRGSLQRKRERIPLVVFMAVVLFAPLGLTSSLKVFLTLIPAYFLAEGIYFQFQQPVVREP